MSVDSRWWKSGVWTMGLAGAIAVAWAPADVMSQRPAAGAAGWSVSRTSWGDPDLQGMWSNFDKTPFERPNPDPVAAAAELAAVAARNSPGPRDESGNRTTPNPWAVYDSPTSPRRPSLVVDPPDGRVPVIPGARRDYERTHIQDSWLYHSPQERCITRGVPSVMFPVVFNNGYQILQSPGNVVIIAEMVHDARVIPVDGRPHVSQNIRLWDGDPRGHWEGSTLVVDTTNFNDQGALNGGVILSVRQSRALHVVERFTRVDANTINYQATIEDPGAYSRPWTVALPLNRDPNYRIYEYACHEGNTRYMEGTLRSGRIADALAEEAVTKNAR